MGSPQLCLRPLTTFECGFRAKWGTDSDGKWGGISTEVGHFRVRGRNGAALASKWCPINFGRLPHFDRNERAGLNHAG
jgi:hypothetical protein